MDLLRINGQNRGQPKQQRVVFYDIHLKSPETNLKLPQIQ